MRRNNAVRHKLSWRISKAVSFISIKYNCEEMKEIQQVHILAHADPVTIGMQTLPGGMNMST